jgi:hypothetical protein
MGHKSCQISTKYIYCELKAFLLQEGTYSLRGGCGNTNSSHWSVSLTPAFRLDPSQPLELAVSCVLLELHILLCINLLKQNGDYMYHLLYQSVIPHFVFMGLV